MWTLLKAEFRYHRVLLAGYGGLLILMFAYESESFVLYTIMPFLAVQQMISTGFSEKRNRLFAGLPVSRRGVATVRALIVLIPLLAISAGYSFFHLAIAPEQGAALLQPWCNAGLVILVFLVMFLVTDLNPLRYSGDGEYRWLAILGLLVLLVLAVVAFLLLKWSGASPHVVQLITDPMVAVVKFVFSTTGTILVHCANAGLAVLTVWSYGRLRSYA